MKNSNILVVDDSMSNLLLLKDILSGFEYGVIIENDGDNVISVLKNNKIDLILLDIMMPKTDGFQVCKTIKQQPEFKEIPIIFLTAKVDETSLLQGFELGGVDYIKKPFLISELMARVQTHIQLQKTTENLKKELYQHSLTQQSLQISQTELSVRNSIASIFLTSENDELYTRILQEILKYTDCRYGAIGYIDENGNLQCPALISDVIEPDATHVYNPQNIDFCGQAILTQSPVATYSAYEPPFYTSAPTSFTVAVPIVNYNTTIGLIAISGGVQQKYKQEYLDKVTSLAGYISPILAGRLTAERHERAKRIAERRLRENEDKYRTLFNQNNDAVFVYYTDDIGILHLSEVNETAINMIGITKDDILKGGPVDFIEPMFAKSALQRLMNSLTEPQYFETYIKSKNNTTIPVEIHAGRFSTNDKYSMIAVVRDISERKDMEKQILNTIVETEERERRKYASEVQHGLGAILSSINTYINIIEDGKISQSEIPTVIKEIKQLVSQAAKQTQDIAENLTPNLLENFGLLASVKNLCKHIAPNGKPRIIFETEEFIETKDKKTNTAIFRIISELLANAASHSQADKVIICLKSNDEFISIDYSDNGIGFDTQTLKKRPHGGLTAIKGRVQNLNGSLKIQSQPNLGVTINIIIRP